MSKMLKLSDFDNSCFPTSIQQVTQLDEHTVLKVSLENNFSHKTGMGMFDGKKALKKLGFEIQPGSFYDCYDRTEGFNMTVNTFLKKYNRGTYLVSISGHIFPVVNGIPIDICVYKPQLKSKVRGFVKIVNSTLHNHYERCEYSLDARVYVPYYPTSGMKPGSVNFKRGLELAGSLETPKNKFDIYFETITVREILERTSLKKSDLTILAKDHRIFYIK